MPFSTETYDRYSDLIHLLLDANSQIPVQVRDAELRQATELASMATEQSDLMADVSRQTTVAGLLSPNGIDTSEEITRIATLLSAFNANNEQIRNVSDPYTAIVQEDFPQEIAERLNQNVEAAIGSRTIDDLQAFMDGVTPTPGEGYWAIRDKTIDALNDRADSLNARASARQRLFTLLALAALALAATMTWLVARSITRPLRSLTHQAKEMAEQRLPTAVREILETPLGQDVAVPHVVPVTVKSRDEVTDVSEALNTVQESALDLAVEQAVLRRNIADSIVNLGRRNQNLLGRQLDFITELERNEADPDTLASLFRLDHLATRMRRNAESLLVLAGVEPPRTWVASVRMSDVIRAALGEVEDYQRIRVEAVEPAMVVGSATADLAHLLAELLENALTFSPPDAYVTVRGGWHSGHRFRLAVIDGGLGMAPAALDLANRRLAGAESFTVAPSRYLGHYVAGNLAARHGIGIRLEPGQAQGTVATVDLPAELVTAVESAPEPQALAPPLAARERGRAHVGEPPDDRTADGPGPRFRPRGWQSDESDQSGDQPPHPIANCHVATVGTDRPGTPGRSRVVTRTCGRRGSARSRRPLLQRVVERVGRGARQVGDDARRGPRLCPGVDKAPQRVHRRDEVGSGARGRPDDQHHLAFRRRGPVARGNRGGSAPHHLLMHLGQLARDRHRSIRVARRQHRQRRRHPARRLERDQRLGHREQALEVAPLARQEADEVPGVGRQPARHQRRERR